MNSADGARAEILRRIHEALEDVPAAEPAAADRIERGYRQSGRAASDEAMIEQFSERIADYKVLVRRTEERTLPAVIAELCAARDIHRLAVPVDLPESWLPATVELLCDDGTLTNEQLDHDCGVLTGCALGIAQTGTLVLDGGVAQGRRTLSLLPDYHLCVLFTDQIVDLVPEAIARLADAVRLHQRPITFISGPSATSDIELSRVEGVHGPRTLEVVIVDKKRAVER